MASLTSLQNALTSDLQSRPTSSTQAVSGEMSRPNNLQRIAQKKSQVRNFSRTKKLEKLAVYSSCKVRKLVHIHASSCTPH
jgi:hypothetical protein